MPRLLPRCLFSWLVLLAPFQACARAEAEKSPLVIGAGELQSISVEPGKVLLRGADQTQQLVVTGHYANGGVCDVTTQAAVRVDDSKVVRVEKGGMLVSISNGTSAVTLAFAGKSIQVQVLVQEADRLQPISFTNEVVPIFSKLGCNAGACHGKASGQNGFKLSLLGFEPQIDYEALTRESRGRRLLLCAPEDSLLLLKPTGTIAHGGGRRLPVESRDYQTLLRWIRAGAPFGNSGDPQLVGISVTPAHRLAGPRSRQQLAVTGRYSDGSRRDLTAQSEYSSNDTELVRVGETGLAETLDLPGEGSVMVRHLGHVALFRVTIPQEVPPAAFVQDTPANFIDQHVFAKLRQLGIPPSDLCTDSEFLRRASLDVTGTLPTAEEAKKFLADQGAQKREKLVEDLLNRPAYASYFALKWGDILRNRRNGLVGVGGGAVRTTALHSWIRTSLATNKPYDQFVREVLTARGDFSGPDAQPPVGWYNVLRTPQALVDDTAQVFLGTRMQCAQCHHHPYEKWSQDDYWGLAAFFARVQLVNPKAKGPAKGNTKPDKNGTRVILAAEGRVTDPQGKAHVKPRLLGGEALAVPADQDPREHLVSWMVQPDNPFFARALVNRYWAHFFGRGIVEMPDDMRITNPPSNPQLLDALAADFVEHKFDLKHLIRTIATSKTYQRSCIPNEHNRKDRQNFARFYPRRLPAEVFLDAIEQVTRGPSSVPSGNGALKGGDPRAKAGGPTRAIDLPDEAAKSPLLAAFGKPERGSACECERSNAATLTQSLLMLTSPEIHGKLKSATCQPGLLAKDQRPHADKIQEIFLAVYARWPTADELKTAEEFLKREEGAPPQGLARGQATAARQWAYEDLFWALLNTKEFMLNH